MPIVNVNNLTQPAGFTLSIFWHCQDFDGLMKAWSVIILTLWRLIFCLFF